MVFGSVVQTPGKQFKYNITHYIKLIDIFSLYKKVPCMFKFGLFMKMRITCTMKSFQVCEICTTPCYMDSSCFILWLLKVKFSNQREILSLLLGLWGKKST